MKAQHWLWVGVGLLAALRLVLAATTGIVEDEAYYWTWARQLAWGYYDHPPAIAAVIAASDAVFGATALGVRGAAVILGSMLPLLLAPWAKDRRLLLLLLGGMPLYTLGGVLATPDVPLLFGWTLALAGACRGAWGLAGLGAGLAGLAKYSGWGIWPLFVLAELHEVWLARRAGHRHEFPFVGMLAGMLLTGMVIAPNLVWNAQHDWISIRFQFDHGLVQKEAPGLWGAATFAGAQLLLVTPVLFGAMVAGWVSAFGKGAGRIERLGMWTSMPVFLFFTWAGSRAQGEPNWAAPAWIGASLLLSRSSGRIFRGAWLGGAFAAILSLAVVVHLYVPLVDLDRDPTARLGVGRDLADSVAAWGSTKVDGSGENRIGPVYTNRYQEAALLRYYRGIEAYALPGVDRADQFDLWPIRWSEHALFVRPWRGSPSIIAEKFCERRGSPNVVTQRNIDGSVFSRWQVFEVWDCGRPGREDAP